MFAFLGKINRLSSPTSFRAEFEFTDRLFQIFGLNYETFRDDRLMFNQIIPYMGLMVTPVFLIFAATAIRMNIDKSDILINALIGTFVASNCTTKMLTIFMNASKFKGFRRKIIKETTNTDREPFECDLLERYMQIMIILRKLMFGSYVMAAISLSSMPIVYSLFVANRWQLPFPIKIIGIDEASHPGYEIHYAYCVITIMYGGLAIAACDLTFFYLSFYAMYRLDVCISHCEQIGRNLHESHRTLLKSIETHVDIFVFIKEVSKAFSSFILAQGILSLMMLTVTIFYSKLNPINSTYVFQFTLLIQLFSYCTCGQLVLNKGENVARAIYCSKWYKISNHKQRQWIQMFILGAQKRNGLSAMNIFQFSFVSLTNILKSAASYIAFLQNVMD